MTQNMTLFTQNLKSFRIQKGFSQKQLATHLRIGLGNIARYERGEVMPKLDIVILIAKTLGISLDTLCGLNKGIDTELEGLVQQIQKLDNKERALVKAILEKFV